MTTKDISIISFSIHMTNWKPTAPYNELPELPPLCEIETKEILKQCIAARSALAELKQAAELIPNQSMLINTLPIIEAQASSEIENIVTTTDKLFQFSEFESQADSVTKEALRYRTALFSGFNSLKEKPLGTNTAVLVCSEIQGRQIDIRKITGTALRNANTGNVIYTPPEGESLIRDKLANWEKFIHNNHTLDPLIILAIAHYQFEAIHPFNDGNGRTGRVLNSLMLIEKGLLTLPVLYLSRYIIKTKNDYYQGLFNVTRKNAWHDWVMYMLKGIEETAIWTKNKIREIRQLRENMGEFIKKELPNIYSHELVDTLFEQPYVRIYNLEQKDIAKRQTASKYLHALAQKNVLTENTKWRDKLFINHELVNLLINHKNEN